MISKKRFIYLIWNIALASSSTGVVNSLQGQIGGKLMSLAPNQLIKQLALPSLTPKQLTNSVSVGIPNSSSRGTQNISYQPVGQMIPYSAPAKVYYRPVEQQKPAPQTSSMYRDPEYSRFNNPETKQQQSKANDTTRNGSLVDRLKDTIAKYGELNPKNDKKEKPDINKENVSGTGPKSDHEPENNNKGEPENTDKALDEMFKKNFKKLSERYMDRILKEDEARYNRNKEQERKDRILKEDEETKEHEKYNERKKEMDMDKEREDKEKKKNEKYNERNKEMDSSEQNSPDIEPDKFNDRKNRPKNLKDESNSGDEHEPERQNPRKPQNKYRKDDHGNKIDDSDPENDISDKNQRNLKHNRPTPKANQRNRQKKAQEPDTTKRRKYNEPHSLKEESLESEIDDIFNEESRRINNKPVIGEPEFNRNRDMGLPGHPEAPSSRDYFKEHNDDINRRMYDHSEAPSSRDYLKEHNDDITSAEKARKMFFGKKIRDSLNAQAKIDERILNLESKLFNVQTKINTMKNDKTALETKNDQIKSATENNENIIKQLKDEIESNQGKIKIERQELERLQGLINEEKNKILILDEQQKAFTKRMEGFTRDGVDSFHSVSENAAKIQDYRRVLEHLEIDYKNLKEGIEDLKRKKREEISRQNKFEVENRDIEDGSHLHLMALYD